MVRVPRDLRQSQRRRVPQKKNRLRRSDVSSPVPAWARRDRFENVNGHRARDVFDNPKTATREADPLESVPFGAVPSWLRTPRFPGREVRHPGLARRPPAHQFPQDV